VDAWFEIVETGTPAFRSLGAAIDRWFETVCKMMDGLLTTFTDITKKHAHRTC
jgi:hypothetical protein